MSNLSFQINSRGEIELVSCKVISEGEIGDNVLSITVFSIELPPGDKSSIFAILEGLIVTSEPSDFGVLVPSAHDSVTSLLKF